MSVFRKACITSAPALGLIEMGSIARGMLVADAMVKKAEIELLGAYALTPGKFVAIVAGGVEECEEAMMAGEAVAAEALVDRLFLPQADEQLGLAIREGLAPCDVASLGIVETFSVAAAVLAADRAVKAADATLVRMRLAQGLGGKAFFVLSAELPQLEVAIGAARSVADSGMLLATEIIAAPHPDFIDSLWDS